MTAQELSTVMRQLDVAISLFDSLNQMLENSSAVRDMHPLACLAAEGKRQLNQVVDVLSDKL